MAKVIDKMKELKDTIIENPELPIRFFIGEDCNCGEFPYEEHGIYKIIIDDVILYNNEYCSKEDFEDKLFEDLSYKFKTEERINKEIDKIIKNKKFEKTISVFIG